MNSTEAMEYLMRTRCLRPETISRFGIRADEAAQAWAYPVDGGTRYKAFDPKKSGRKYWHTPGTPNQLYGLSHVPDGSRDVWLVNGEPSVWACTQAGLPAVCGLYGEGQLPDDSVLRLLQKGVRTVHVVFDLDEKGEKAAELVYVALREPLIVIVHRLPEGLGAHGDAGDLYTSTGGQDEVFVDLMKNLPEVPMHNAATIAERRRARRPRRSLLPAGDRWWIDQNVLLEVVSSRIEVKKEGTRWRALCPFHPDRHPSLVLYPDGWFHCFGCSAHGTAVDFVARLDDIPWKEALRAVREQIYGTTPIRR